MVLQGGLEPTLTLCNALGNPHNELCLKEPLPGGVFCRTHVGDPPARGIVPASVRRCQSWIYYDDGSKTQCRRPEDLCTCHQIIGAGLGSTDEDQQVVYFVERMSYLEEENSALVGQNTVLAEYSRGMEVAAETGKLEKERLEGKLRTVRQVLVAHQGEQTWAQELLSFLGGDSGQDLSALAGDGDLESFRKDREIARLAAELEKVTIDRDALADNFVAYTGRPQNQPRPEAPDFDAESEGEGSETVDDAEDADD